MPPRKDLVHAGAWFSVEEWGAFKEVCERLVERRILPENPSKYLMVRYAVLATTRHLRKVFKIGEVKPAETEPVEVKPAETKPVEVKPAETEPVENKSEFRCGVI